MNMIADSSFESLLKVEVKETADDTGGESQLERFRTSTGLLFLEPGREEALRLVGHLLRYSDQLIAIVGAEASGKNHLMRAFAEANADTLNFSIVKAEQFMSASALSACIGQKLASRLAYVGDLEEWSAQIVNWSEELEKTGARAVVVIDDAQHLSESALEMLADLIVACSGSVGIRFILMGTAELRAHLDHSRLVGQLLGKCHFVEVEPFDAQTSAHFLSWSLASHSLSPDLFTADERRYILQQGKGLPGLIRETSVQVMDKGIPALDADEESAATSPIGGLARSLGRDNPQSAPHRIKYAYAVVGLILLVGVSGVLYQFFSGERGGVDQVGEIEMVRVQAPRIAPTISVAAPETVVSAEAGLPPVENTLEAVPHSLPTESPAAGPAPRAVDRTPEREAFLAKREPLGSGPRSAEWLLEKSPETYVLQMLGTHSESGARRYINEQENPQAFIMFATKMNGKPWYVVVYGHHPDRAAALAAIKRLPTKLRDRKPWARSVESVHKAILEGRHA